MLKSEVKNRFEGIRLLILDFQGVLVPEGTSAQFFPRVELNKLVELCGENGINIAVITSFEHIPEDFPREIILCRSTMDKLGAAERILQDLGLMLNQTAYIADGILDLPLLQKCGFSGAPIDARREVKRTVDFIFDSEAGAGLIDEMIGLIFVGEPEEE